MSDINITLPARGKKRLLTKDKYCNSNIVVTSDVTTVEQATPQLSFNDTDGTFTVVIDQTTGWVEGERKTEQYGLPCDGGGTAIPSTRQQTLITGGTYVPVGFDVKVAGDPNLIKENIVKGISIFGVEGTYEGSSAPDFPWAEETYF